MQEELAACPVVFAVKEIPLAFFRPGGAYMFFAHVIKGQPHNMPMLRRMLALGCTLIDYEKVTDEHGRRLIFLRLACRAGRHYRDAVGAGAALGRAEDRHAVQPGAPRLGVSRPGRGESRHRAGRPGHPQRTDCPPACAPLTIGVTGYGNVSHGRVGDPEPAAG